MRAAVLSSILLIGGLVVPAAADSAPTAEETVTYLIAGVTDGSKLANQSMKMPNGKENTLSLTTTKKSDCTYDIVLKEKIEDREQTQTASLDFSKVKNMEYQSDRSVKVTSDGGYCTGNIPPACQGKLAVDVDGGKYKQAYTDLRSRYCK